MKDAPKYLVRGYSLEDVIVPLAIILASGVLGYVVEIVARKVFRRKAESQGWRTAINLLSSLRGIVVIWMMLIALEFVMDQFPLSNRGEILLSRIARIALIVSVTILVSRLVVNYLQVVSRREDGSLPAISIIQNLIRVVIFIVGALTIFRTLGISVTPVLTALGVGGLAVALALQDTLSNLFAGIYIIASRQINRGDYVKLSTGEEGYINDIAWRVTSVYTTSGNMIVIPNAKLAQSTLTNFHRPQRAFSASASITFAFDSDIVRAEQIMVETAESVRVSRLPDVKSLTEFQYGGVVDTGVILTVSLKTEEQRDIALFRNEFYRQVIPRLAAAKIKFGPLGAPAPAAIKDLPAA